MYYPRFAVLSFALLAACSDSSGPAKENPSGGIDGGTVQEKFLSAKGSMAVTGALTRSSQVRGGWYNNDLGGPFIHFGDSVEVLLARSGAAPTVGTFPIGSTFGSEWSGYVEINISPFTDREDRLFSTSGTVTIASVTSSRIAGTYTMNARGRNFGDEVKAVGSFDVAYIPGLVP